MKITIVGRNASIEITPEDLSDIFWDMDKFEKARFFRRMSDTEMDEDIRREFSEIDSTGMCSRTLGVISEAICR